MIAKAVGVLVAVPLCLIVACGGAPQEVEEPSQPEEREIGPAEKAEYFMGQAGLAIAEGDESTALDYYLAAAEVYDEIGEETVDRAEAHFYAADYLYKFSHREQAIEEYDAAVRIYLKYADNSQIKAAVALNNMGSIHRELHEKSKARSCWERALQIYKNASEERKNHQHIAKIEQNLRDLAEGF